MHPPAARAFSSGEPLARERLLGAPVRWPRPSRLQAPLRLPGKRMAAGARTLGLDTVGDLLQHLPSDSRESRTLAELRAGEPATVEVVVRSISARPVRRRGMRPLVEARVADAGGSVRARFFNQPWLVERYPPGTRLLLHGKPDGRGGFGVSHHALAAGPAAGGAGAPAGESGGRIGAVVPAGEAAEGGTATVAHYPATEGLSSTQILTLVRGARASLGDFPELLPAAVRAGCELPDKPAALTAAHFAEDQDERERARRRLAFEELLATQLLFLRRRARRRSRSGAIALAEPPRLTERWLASGLPFALTGDQRHAIEEIAGDLGRTAPMQRLLMGEVGSGKTVVARHAMLRAVEHGAQAAMMAPTETLAEQHFATIQQLLGSEPVSVALLTGSTPGRRRSEILARLAGGELSLVVGTHALIEPDVRFAELAVAVVDEQHRFGVRQRTALSERPGRPPAHTLHMTATPIPRTLALARYGDLDTTLLRERPAGRPPVRTSLAFGEQERAAAYEELREQLRAGRQAYVVCPLIEEGEPVPGTTPPAAGEELRAARSELVRLSGGELADFGLVLLHGGMRPREKQEAMAAFASGAADVLIATTVIEVGIDVPNAAVMLIENAERFGISQLHQLRGRVGRGEHPSLCCLMGPSSARRSARLRALAEYSDGFRLAEIDLRLRSEGELVGTRQSGLGSYRFARLPEDERLLELARRHGERMTAEDPELSAPEHALLGAWLAAGGELEEPLAA
ncbi:MAG TPA: ATP-dependent DNA helicase RecG [Solirubrobacteraceae bacterium]|nr:ATP-dependent DNA helicase RecG [Solirubrobacteraceae bacterium]